MKKIVALLIALILAVTALVSVSAEDIKPEEDMYNKVLNETVQIKDNEVKFFTYNITKNHKWATTFYPGGEESKEILVYAKDCVDKPYVMSATKDVVYKVGLECNGGGSGYQYFKYDTTGGTYRKVRFKLSQFPWFNEDGSLTGKNYTYRFGDDQYEGRNRYSSVLVFFSGGAVTFAAPDKDGWVEFYVCTDIDVRTSYSYDTQYRIISDGYDKSGGDVGVNGVRVSCFTKGCVSNDSTSVRILMQHWFSFIVRECNNSTKAKNIVLM